jgi:hypothetical protein
MRAASTQKIKLVYHHELVEPTGNRLSPAWIRNADERIHETRLLVMIPITQDNSELSIIISSISFIRRMQQEGGTQPVHIYSLHGESQVSLGTGKNLPVGEDRDFFTYV